MATDFSERERAFVDSLAADTGLALEGWMAEITGCGLSQRNDIIDWLRHRGFPFSKASWLERIHHNGGRLIYRAADLRPPSPERRQPSVPGPAMATPAPRSAVIQVADAADGAVDALLATAKAYRPLAQVVLRDILAAAPGAELSIANGHIVVGFDQPFAALAPTPRDVRLLLALGPGDPPEGWQRTKFPAGVMAKLGRLTHMIHLTDARQMTGYLRGLVAESIGICRD